MFASTAVTEGSHLLAALAEFRYQLRCFTAFSEKAAQDVHLHPQQHQLLLQIAGSANSFVGEFGEPAFNQVQPAAACGHIVDDKTTMFAQPVFDFGGAMR